MFPSTERDTIMATVAAQIEEIRAANRKVKKASFREYLKNTFGRVPKKGDIIMLSDAWGHSISEVGGPYKVIGVGWDYNTPSLEVICPMDSDGCGFYANWKDANKDGDNYELEFTRRQLKNARFARPAEVDGTAFMWEVKVDTRGPYDRSKKKWTDVQTIIMHFATIVAAERFARKAVKEWNNTKGRATYSSSYTNLYDKGSYTNLYDKDGNHEGHWGSVTRYRVRKTEHPFK
jgi:hypothetical protein